MKLGRSGLVFSLVLLCLILLPNTPFVPAPHQVAGDVPSAVWVTPIQTCCIVHGPGSVFTVNVMMNLSGAEAINAFDVRLNYTNWYAPNSISKGVVKAVSIDYSNNVFVQQNYQVTTQASCIDDVTYGPDGFCASDDFPGGQVHVAQTILQTTMPGPVTDGLLFSVKFTVNATGISVLFPERAHLVNPGGTPSNPHFVQVTTGAAVFGNNPLVAFFDYASTLSPSVLSGVNARFDASASFRSTLTGRMSLAPPSTFKWDFGDGLTNQTSNPMITHSFLSPGNYTVGLTVNDTNPGGGYIQRIVQVSPRLGSLHISAIPDVGAVLPGVVTVKLYNDSGPVPQLCHACNQTISAGGTADYRGLTPGAYTMNLTGPGVIATGRQTQIQLGWTTMETVYLTVIQAPKPNTIGLEIFIGIVGGGLSVAGLGLFVRWRRKGKLITAGGSSQKTRKTSRP